MIKNLNFRRIEVIITIDLKKLFRKTPVPDTIGSNAQQGLI
jgi:hypothetical protein